jgi:phenylalanyl-tRNA synthetase beta chain
MRDVQIGPSPVWLQVFLAKSGVHTVNNVVDYTNYFMLLTGQPLHAYDYDKVRALSEGDQAVIVVRNPRENEKIALLNGKTIDPRQQAILIATNKQLIGIGGVMGGSDTEVDENTKNIIIESATFDMYSVRRTSMEHGLFTDGVTRFSKGQSPLQNRAVLAKIVTEIQTHASGKIASDIIDISQVEGREWVHPPVPVTVDFINTRLGLTLSSEEMKLLLQNVEFSIEISNDTLTVTAPFWRTDIETREDVVEEVGRLYGFDKLPLDLPQRSITPAQKDVQLELKSRIREMLVKCGANEVLTYSFVHGNLLDKVGQDKSQAFRLSNALSPDLQYYRLSLIPSLLDKVHPNIKAGYEHFALFEIGKSHHAARSSEEGLPIEDDVVALVVAARTKTPQQGAAFYAARAYIDYLAAKLGIELELVTITEPLDDEASKPFVPNRSAAVRTKDSGKIIGIVGEFTRSTQKNLKLPDYSAGFEVNLDGLTAPNSVHAYAPLSRFPSVNQDLSLRVNSDVAHGALVKLIEETLQTHVPEHAKATMKPLGIYAPADNDGVRHHSFRIEMVNFERTMTTDEISKLIDTVATAAHDAFAAERI